MTAAHETLAEHRPPPGGSNRNFGLTVGGILLLLGLARALFGSGFSATTFILITAGTLLLAAALLDAARLAPLNRLWTRLGLLMARVVNPVVLSLIFVLAFVPTGLLMRVFRHDALRLKRQPATGSYWIERQPPGPAPDTMRNQF